MNTILHWLAGATLMGSGAIALTLIFVPLMRKGFGARAAHGMWIFTLVLLLSPWVVRSPVSVMPKTTADVPELVVRVVVKPTPGAMTVERTPRAAFPWGFAIWAGGTGTLLVVAMARGFYARRIAREAADITDSLREVWEELGGLPRGTRIGETAKIRGPAVCGLWRPMILLPVGWTTRASAEELRWMLRHEIGHVRRGDLWWRWIFQLARAVHWFNPLVWVAERAMRVDQEMACDEWVLAHARTEDAAAYGEAILKAAQPRKGWLLQAGMAESGHGLTQRIRHLATAHPRGLWAALVALTLGTAALLLLAPGEMRAEDAGATPAATVPTGAIRGEVEFEAKFVEVNPEIAAEVFGSDKTETQTILENEKLQQILRKLNQKKGVDLVSAPKVTVKSQQKARIEISREFRYPTEFQPPEKIPAKSPNEATTIVPATPTAFEARNVGLTLDVEPEVLADGRIICNLKPETVEFEGFINYGAGRDARSSGDAIEEAMKPGREEPAEVVNNVINQPVFQVRQMVTTVVLRPGQTALLGGLSRKEKQKIEDVIDGRTVTTEKDLERILYVFVTARLMQDENALRVQAITPAMLSNSAPSPTPPPAAKGETPYGAAVPGKPGFITSPWAPDQGQVDVRGFPKGTQVKCPYTGKIFLVP